ncbi:hypothetical protein HII36_54570 [Nonomuraea sp. NN258]|uniref:hypothetical protein n=1 Tax=Nonomuraea antri TaxID=2730852 RepID=UPI0015697BB3|nr:hypothetical protein [Nonomuraea antri]NRQ40774.1 hypothetical protein [Nonomuraea antri]
MQRRPAPVVILRGQLADERPQPGRPREATGEQRQRPHTPAVRQLIEPDQDARQFIGRQVFEPFQHIGRQAIEPFQFTGRQVIEPGQGAGAFIGRQGIEARQGCGGVGVLLGGRFSDRLHGAQRPGRSTPFPLVMATMVADRARHAQVTFRWDAASAHRRMRRHLGAP